MMVSSVLLTGGKSSRMGQDKALLQVRGESLLDRQLRLLKEVGGGEILVSIRQDCPGRLELDPSIQPVQDRLPDIGPLGGIDAAFHRMCGTHLLVLAVDLPQMNSPLLQLLLSRSTETRGVVPRLGHQLEPLVALYPATARSVLTEQLVQAEFSVAEFARRCQTAGLVQFWDVPKDLEPAFLNWNRPEDWSSLKAPVAPP